jgi:hypothetical protein
MKKYLLLIIILSGLNSCIFNHNPQSQRALKQTVYEQGKVMGDAFLKKDYDTFLSFTHPKIIELAGGKDSLKRTFQKGLGGSIDIVSMDVGKPEKVLKLGKTMQCVIKEKVVIIMSSIKMTNTPKLICISYDSGVHWYFIEANPGTIDKIKVTFPELDPRIIKEVQEEPKYLKDKN